MTCVFLLAACQKEPTGRLELIAESMGSDDTKMYVDGLASYWMTGDKVYINGNPYEITVDGTHAIVDGSFSEDNYLIGFPESIALSDNGPSVRVLLPMEYRYMTDGPNGSGHQVLDAPLVYEGPATGGKVQLKHITGALAVKINGFTGLKVDSIIVYSVTSEGDAHYRMSGYFDVNKSTLECTESDWSNFGASNHVAMIFDETKLEYERDGAKTVQIPVPATPSDTYYRIRVVGHKLGNKFVYDRTQATGGRLKRAELGYAYILLAEYPGNGSLFLTRSPYFQTEVVSGVTYNKVYSGLDLRVMFECCREGGSYKTKNYLIKNSVILGNGGPYSIGETFDIEPMSGNTYTGTIKGDGELGKSISGLRINGHSLFTCGNNNERANIEGIRLIDIHLRSNEGGYFGSFYDVVQGNLTLNNCYVNGLYVDVPEDAECCIGGLVGKHYGSALNITDCVFGYDGYRLEIHSNAAITFGGLIGSIGRNNATCTVNNCLVHASNIILDGGSNVVTAGGLFGKINDNMSMTATNNRLIGTMTVTGGASSCAGAYVGSCNDGVTWTSSGNYNNMTVTVNGETPTGGISLN